jgi:hypothetical protein
MVSAPAASGLSLGRHVTSPLQQHMIGYARRMASLRSGPRNDSSTYVQGSR